MRTIVIAMLPLLLAGCTSGTVTRDINATGASEKQATVRVIEGTVPPNARPLGEVQAYSCKHWAWDPPPTEANAIAQLKIFAAERQGNAIANVYCDKSDGVSYGPDCWSYIRCTATAMAIG